MLPYVALAYQTNGDVSDQLLLAECLLLGPGQNIVHDPDLTLGSAGRALERSLEVLQTLLPAQTVLSDAGAAPTQQVSHRRPQAHCDRGGEGVAALRFPAGNRHQHRR